MMQGSATTTTALRYALNKVELSDANKILNTAKQLQYNYYYYYSGTYVNNCVPDDVMKLRRRQCDALNLAHLAHTKPIRDRNGRDYAMQHLLKFYLMKP
jgi:hypothetical protein